MMIEALLANAAILLGLALILWVLALQKDDVSFVHAFWGGGIALLALHRLLRWRREGANPRYARLLGSDRAKGRFAWAALVKVFLLQALLAASAGWWVAACAMLGPLLVTVLQTPARRWLPLIIMHELPLNLRTLRLNRGDDRGGVAE